VDLHISQSLCQIRVVSLFSCFEVPLSSKGYRMLLIFRCRPSPKRNSSPQRSYLSNVSKVAMFYLPRLPDSISITIYLHSLIDTAIEDQWGRSQFAPSQSPTFRVYHPPHLASYNSTTPKYLSALVHDYLPCLEVLQCLIDTAGVTANALCFVLI